MTTQTAKVLRHLLSVSDAQPVSAIAGTVGVLHNSVTGIMTALHREGWASFEMEDRVAALQQCRFQRRLWSITETGRIQATERLANPRPTHRKTPPASDRDLL
ncbi:hypothetical protein [Modestobacter sp. DSM 44400]|uniref:hypothetical protein n=1 Tax=Modestobacter sp. DSM 44400 TaxID=1550230 RepID=UPI0011150E25|nr:hypothetical protein [Modestobacter sp. DSM 44400]